MPLTSAGATFLAGAATGVSAPLFDSGNAYIGVGDSNVSFANSQTDLQATPNVLRKPMDVLYPKTVGNLLTFQSTFGATDANWAWNEWGVFNAASAGVMLSRKVEYNGTKLPGQTWILQVQVAFNVGV